MPKAASTDVVTDPDHPGFDKRFEGEDAALQVKALEGGELLVALESDDTRAEFKLEPEHQADLMMAVYVCWLNRGGADKGDFGFVDFRPKGD